MVNAAPVRAPVVQRGALQVVAAEPEKKKVLKKMPSPVKRALITEERRMYNRQRKSACATRVKKASYQCPCINSGAEWPIIMACLGWSNGHNSAGKRQPHWRGAWDRELWSSSCCLTVVDKAPTGQAGVQEH